VLMNACYVAVSGTMIGSPSGSMHDIQNRIMSPVHGQGMWLINVLLWCGYFWCCYGFILAKVGRLRFGFELKPRFRFRFGFLNNLF